MMKQFVKILLTLAVATLIVVLVRACLFTVFTVTADLGPALRKGDRVLVNRIGDTRLHRGELMVFYTTEPCIGQVVAVPGDTIVLRSGRYVIPYRCCDRCLCPDCKLYLVNTGQSRILVHRHQVLGPAYRLFYLPW